MNLGDVAKLANASGLSPDTERFEDSISSIPSNYFYKQIKYNLFTVGFYDSKGVFIPDSDHKNIESVKFRIEFLNRDKGEYEDECEVQ
jgi:hypothetical protein